MTNYSRQNSTSVVDVSIAYEASIGEVEQALNNILQEVYRHEEDIVNEPVVLGVQELGDSGVVLRITAECNPMTHWAIARKLRRVIKDRFDELDIEIPYPRLVTYRKEEH